MLSAGVTGTLAWRDYAQHKSNEFNGIAFGSHYADLTVTKRVEMLNAALAEEEPAPAAEGEPAEGEQVTAGEDKEPADEGRGPAGDGQEPTGEGSEPAGEGLESAAGEDIAPFGAETAAAGAETAAAGAALETGAASEAGAGLEESAELEEGEGFETDPGLEEGDGLELSAAQNEGAETDAGSGISPMRFEFTVMFTGVEDGPVVLLIDGKQEEGAEISGGLLAFELAGGQTAVIKGLPVGAMYTVEEKPVDGYIGVCDNNQGFIPPDGAYVNYVNYFGGGDNPGPFEAVILPPVKKIVSGSPDKDVEFRFRIEAVGQAPMPAGSVGPAKTITIKGEGESNFGLIHYTEPGAYHYRISEVKTDEKGWTYDETVYDLTVMAMRQTDGITMMQALTTVGGLSLGDTAVFTNVYSENPDKPYEPDKPGKPDKPVTPGTPDKPVTPGTPDKPVTPGTTDRPKTGDSSNIWLWAITMMAGAVALRALTLYRGPDGRGGARRKQDGGYYGTE